MRYQLLIILSIIVLFSCSVDDLPGCEGSGSTGEICKEYQYVNGDYNGLNNYFYDETGSVLISKVTVSSSGKKEGSVFYSYNSISKLSGSEYLSTSGDVVKALTYKYNSDGVLIEEQNSVDFDQIKNYNYVNGILETVSYSESGILTAKDSLEYFTGTSDLYRTIKYIGGNISSVVYNEWFGSDVLKESTFDAVGTKVGSFVSRYNGDGVLVEKIEYTAGNNVKIKEVYSYSGNLLIEIVKKDGQGNEFEKLVYQRF